MSLAGIPDRFAIRDATVSCNMLPEFNNTFSIDPTVAYGLMLAGLLADHVLVACRLMGLLVTIPGLNGSALSLHLKCLLLLVTAAVITPNVSHSAKAALQPRATNRHVTQIEDQTVRPVAHAELVPAEGVQIDGRTAESHSSPPVLSSGVEFIRLAICELCLGLILGLGANLVLQGFRMAGQLIDQQLGWGFSTASLDGGDAGTPTGEMLFWMGTVLLFVLGGHLLLVSTLIGTFQTFPPGCGSVNVELVPLMSQLVQQSLILALQLSAPVIATQVLAGLILSHAGAVAPQFQHSGTALAIRVVLASAVLLLTFGGLADRLLDLIPTVIETGVGAISN